MKIAILRQRLAGWGGAEATLGHLVRGLAAAGHEVSLLVAGRQAAPTIPGIRIAAVPVAGGKTGRIITYALRVRHLLRQGDFDVVFSLERTLDQDVYRAGDGCHREWLARQAEFLSAPARCFKRLSLFHRVLLLLEGRMFADPRLRRVIANSRQVQEEMQRHYGVTAEKIRVVYNGLDHEEFRPLSDADRKAVYDKWGVNSRTPVILFVGSGFRRKGLAFLIKAFAALPGKESLLWVVGKGAAGAYRQLAAGLGVAERVRFWGPQEKTALFYQAATVLALPTIYDPGSNVVLEALGCGCPVVTTTANGTSELLTPGRNGAVLAGPARIAELSAALQEYLEQGRDPRVRQAAAEAVAHLNWDVTVTRTMAVLEEAAAMRGMI